MFYDTFMSATVLRQRNHFSVKPVLNKQLGILFEFYGETDRAIKMISLSVYLER